MEIANLPSGKYVVAVSGGVDSVALLDLLSRQKNLELVVAHFDHGIRLDSADDAHFVAQLAARYSLPFVTSRRELGARASEEEARKARYDFLYHTRVTQQARAIITAHHQDDVLETAIINLLRGTGWRGMASLRDLPKIRRPLLDVTKRKILEYARVQHLKWREDSTNKNLRYLRNQVRQQILTKATLAFRQEMLALIARQGELREEIEGETSKLLFCGHAPRTPLKHLPIPAQRSLLLSGASSHSALRGEVSERAPDCGNLVYSDRLILPSERFRSQGRRGLVKKGEWPSSVPGPSLTLDRTKLNLLPNLVAKEVLIEVVFNLTSRRVEQAMLARMLWFVRTARSHKTLQISKFIELSVSKTTVVVRVK